MEDWVRAEAESLEAPKGNWPFPECWVKPGGPRGAARPSFLSVEDLARRLL